ncbi:PREDICTED: probable inactive receptor kinase At2g26730 [Theobroma cacao]|uniref:Probable inactive receptor kinase At2g26730 n=1 Tax=Theobroma cacao TaxID=3641 RepID=A0AB32VAX8_THECC|nr:PREDICTED: probable inactive receptor kinase At2g26730 [Theobroma cacao]
MNPVSIRVLPIFIFLLFHVSNSEDEEVKQSLVEFLDKLAAGNVERGQSWGWNMTSDPCKDNWKGVSCDLKLQSVKKVVLDELNLTGVLDIGSVCRASSLSVLSLNKNNVVGLISEEIGNCKRLTHLYLSGNQLSGDLPESLKQLSNLKRFDISFNNFSGEVPDLSRISGLVTFLAQNNQLSGEIPNLDFSNLRRFNVSNNNFSGPIPDVKSRFSADSFSGNPELCGELVSKACPPSAAPPSTRKSKDSSSKDFLIYFGYVALGLIIVLLVAYKLVRKKKPKEEKSEAVKKGVEAKTSSNKTSSTSNESKTTEHKSEYSISSAESGVALSSLVVLSSPTAQGLRFEDLLRAPAELLGKGKHGSLYKVMLDNGVTTLAVKRIKDWSVTSEDFKSRMQRLDQARHPNVLPSVAFYCSKQEKLLVYEYQPNGSLFRLLHGSQNGQAFNWGSRLNVAASVAKALAFMHEELREDGIAHGNLKSTNILIDKNMDPCISEYGLMVYDSQDQTFHSPSNSFIINNDSDRGQTYGSFQADNYGFGVILLELLTGKLVQNNGFDLARWVHSVVREEWTVEVFDKDLILEGASEERMLNLLQIALKCINPDPHERPSINQVAVMINTLKDEEDRSSSEP